MSVSYRFGCASKCLALLLLSLIAAAQSQTPDPALLHGHILTLDDKDRQPSHRRESRNDCQDIGSDDEILQFAANFPGIRTIDLHGHTATPGLIDIRATLPKEVSPSF